MTGVMKDMTDIEEVMYVCIYVSMHYVCIYVCMYLPRGCVQENDGKYETYMDIEDVMYVCIYVSMHYVWCMYICMYVCIVGLGSRKMTGVMRY